MNFIKSVSKKQWCIGLVTLWILVCLLVTPVYTTITVNYGSDPSGEAITTVFTSLRENVTARGARARVIYEGVARVSFYDLQYADHCSVKRIDPLDENWQSDELVTISDIQIYKNGMPVWEAKGEKLKDYFYGNEQVLLQDSEDGLAFYVQGNDSQLIPTEKFSQEFVSSGRLFSIVTSIFFGLAVMLIMYMAGTGFARGLKLSEDRFGKVTYWIYLGGLSGAVLLCIYIARRSPFWLNPDEYEVRTAVRYYFTHWLPPDIRSDEISDAFAVYGTSRHSEFNTFYFLAGRLGQFFRDAAMQSRWLGMTLFAVMAAMIGKYCRKYFCFLFILLLTPQVWYIFSYTTSDALDFFMGFLTVYELIREDSLLNRLLTEPFSKKRLPGYVLLSLLFVQLFWAKISFYPILLFLFLILLIRLFEKQGKERKELFRSYMILLGMTLAIFLIRYMITDFSYYGFHKSRVVSEMMELRAAYEYKPSTPPHEQAGSIYLYRKGVPLSLFFGEMEFNRNLFRTVAGFFGNYQFGMADWYYMVMAGLYLALFGCLIYELIKMKDRKKWLEFGAVCICIVCQYVLIFINGYFVDFQPQGRYMLPALLYAAYLVYTCKKARGNKIIRLILCAACLLSLYAYGTTGVSGLVPFNTSAL